MKNILKLFILVFILSCSKSEDTNEQDSTSTICSGDYSTAGILVDIDAEIYNDDESVNAYSKYAWSSDNDDRVLSGNGIPNHQVGTFPSADNPNTITAQSVNKRFTLCPEIINESGIAVVGPALAIAYALNSVKFDPATAGRCNDAGECSLAQGEGNWNIEALGHDTFNFGDDMNHAHVQPNGSYHYHGMPELLIEFLGNTQGMTLVGWASDGFPVYARYGYTDANNLDSGIKELIPSYRLKSEPDTNRPNTLTAIIGGPSGGTTGLSTPIEMGAFTQDYEYVEGLGDLDECNGRFGVTPEFPEGVYYYVVTDDFPFFTRCLKGDI
ncbi:MAG: YHYH protein [Polaribacter sp.]|nr:YHYH protein [Polaribacter sp.]